MLSRSELVVVKWHMALQVQCRLLANPQVGVRQTWKELSPLAANAEGEVLELLRSLAADWPVQTDGCHREPTPERQVSS